MVAAKRVRDLVLLSKGFYLRALVEGKWDPEEEGWVSHHVRY